jgi:hypothetical protein
MIFKAIKKRIKKVFSGVKKVVKKIGRGIKKAVQGIGKFMGKIGIVGQLAMSFILPGIGGALMKSIGGFVGRMAASSSPFISGAGKVLQAAGNFAKAGHSAFKTVTEGVGSFVKEFTGAALKKVPGMDRVFPSLADAPDSFFKGKDSAWSKVQANVVKNGNEVIANFDKAIGRTPKVATTGSSIAKKIKVKDATVSAKDMKDMGAGPETFEVEKFTSDDVIIDKPTIGEVKLPEKSLLERTAEFGGKLKDEAITAIQEIPDKIIEAPGKLVDKLDKTVSEGLESKVLQAVGLEDKPEYTTVYEGSTYVPSMDVSMSAGSYASPEINDRAYQMSVNPSGFSMSNPWGNPANTYQQALGARL